MADKLTPVSPGTPVPSADDQIYDMYKRLIQAIPECVAHGECVPHAVEWIEQAKAREERLKAHAAGLQEQVDDALRANTVLTKVTAELRAEITTLKALWTTNADLRAQVATLQQAFKAIGLACNREFRRSSDSDAFVAEIRSILEAHGDKISGARQC